MSERVPVPILRPGLEKKLAKKRYTIKEAILCENPAPNVKAADFEREISAQYTQTATISELTIGNAESKAVAKRRVSGSEEDEPHRSHAVPTVGLMQQWDVIKTCLDQTGIGNHELEDISPCPGFQRELMRAANDNGIFMIQVIFNAGNERSAARAKTVIDRIVQNNSIFRTRIAQHEQIFYQVVVKQPIEWVEFDGSLEAYKAQAEARMDKCCKILGAFNNNDWNEIRVGDICPHVQTIKNKKAHGIDAAHVPSTLAGIFRQPSQSPALIIPAGAPKLGITHGSAVSIALPNTMELIVTFLATTWQSAIAAPLNLAYKQDEFEFYIDDLGSATVIIPRGAYQQERPAIHAARKYEAAIAESYWDADSNKIIFGVKEKGKMASEVSEQTQLLKAKEDDVALELINKWGENISPVELDNVIDKHEHIVEAVSFAIDDETYGQDVGWAVKAADGKDLNEEDLKKWISERIAASMVPRRIWLTETATGKVQRTLVAETMVNG
ncbi:hypothetical protein BST61_g6338 [Cercospora zeina]